MLKYYRILIERFIGFFIILPISSLLLGSTYIYFGGKWNIAILVTITIVSLFLGNLYCKYIDKNDNTDLDAIFFIFLIFLSFLLFGINYSPILEIRQDPSIYLYKALNLINYGTTWQPLEALFELQNAAILPVKDYTGYGAILNGANFYNDKIQLDFFYGSTFLFAYLGKININLLFAAPFILSTSSMIILYNLFRDRLTPGIALISTVLFFVTPGVLWYGRTPFSEPFALMLFLALIIVLKMKEESSYFFISLIAISICFYLVRIDMIVVLFICTFFISSKHPLFGLLTILLFILIFILSQDNYIYFERLKHTPPIKYFYPILFLSSLLGFAENRLLLTRKIISSNFFFYSFFLFVVFISLFAFRDNLPFQLEEAYMHGRLMRTYNETNMEKIFMILPDFMVFIGLLFLPYIVYKKILNYNQLFFLLPLFFFSIYFIYNISNSPQLYWSIRRYLYIFLPTIYISSIYFMSIQRKLVQHFFIAILFLTIVNKTMNVSIFPEMKGLDKSVQEFIEFLPNEPEVLLVYNHQNLRYSFSPIIAFSSYDILPLKDINQISEIATFYKNKKIIFIDSQPLAISEKVDKFVLNYARTGENYDRLPKEKYNKSYTFYLHYLGKDYELIEVFLTSQNAREKINKIYQQYLKRQPEKTGLEHWSNTLIKKKKTLEEIERHFVLSKEYQQRFIENKEVEKVITTLYKDITKKHIPTKVLNRYMQNYDNVRVVNSIFANRD